MRLLFGVEGDGLVWRVPHARRVGPFSQLADGRVVAECDVPERLCSNGRLDEAKVRAVYKGHPVWDRAGVVADAEAPDA